MKLSKYEKETIINFNDDEDTAIVYTCNKALMKKLDKCCSISPLFYREKMNEYSRTYKVPKKYVTIRKPSIFTEEKRAELRDRAKANFGT